MKLEGLQKYEKRKNEKENSNDEDDKDDTAVIDVCTGVGVVEAIQLMALFCALHPALIVVLYCTVQYSAARMPRNHAQTPATRKRKYLDLIS